MEQKKSFGERWRESMAYLKWFYVPSTSMSAREVYELVDTHAFSGDGLYLNLGYWETATDIDTACRDMARLLAQSVDLGPDDTLLDVGCGFGDQDMLFAQEYGVTNIKGINITPTQVTRGNAQIAEAGLSDQIELIEASATELPFQDPIFDAVVALESVFHFDTRADFLAEAYRVMKPNARMALADMIPAPVVGTKWQKKMKKSGWDFFSKKYGIPPENADGLESYAQKLTDAGFTDVKVVSIRQHVFAGLHKHMKEAPEMLARFHPLARFPYKMTLFFDASKVYQAYDYVLATATKPQ